jgi:hypothetical protein
MTIVKDALREVSRVVVDGSLKKTLILSDNRLVLTPHAAEPGAGPQTIDIVPFVKIVGVV